MERSFNVSPAPNVEETHSFFGLKAWRSTMALL